MTDKTQKAEEVVMSVLPPFIQAFLKSRVKLINNEIREIKSLLNWDIRGYNPDTKDQSVNEKYDLWLDKKSGQWCVKHRAIEKLADLIGIEVDPDSVRSHCQPTVDNRYQHIFTLTVKDPDGNFATYVGEANNAGGNLVQNNYNAYPASMAYKRALDRSLLKLIVKLVRRQYLLDNKVDEILVEDDLRVDIESEDFQQQNQQDEGKEKTPTLSDDEMKKLADHLSAINKVLPPEPKSKSKQSLNDYELKVASAESYLTELVQFFAKDPNATEAQKQYIAKVCDEKLKQVTAIRKKYAFGQTK